MVAIGFLNAILDYSSPSRAHFFVCVTVNVPETEVTITGSHANSYVVHSVQSQTEPISIQGVSAWLCLLQFMSCVLESV